MEQTAEEKINVILSLDVGDEVRVTWRDGENQSVEVGKVWDPPDSAFLGIGPDFLNPDDPELYRIERTKKGPVIIAEPPMGSVALWSAPGQRIFKVAVRDLRGWWMPQAENPYSWALISYILGAPTQIFTPGQPPQQPFLQSVTPGDGTITVAAELGISSLPILDVQYRLYWEDEDGSPNVTNFRSSGQSTGNFTITGLTNGTEYSIIIRAVNAAGPSFNSNNGTATPTAP